MMTVIIIELILSHSRASPPLTARHVTAQWLSVTGTRFHDRALLLSAIKWHSWPRGVSTRYKPQRERSKGFTSKTTIDWRVFSDRARAGKCRHTDADTSRDTTRRWDATRRDATHVWRRNVLRLCFLSRFWMCFHALVQIIVFVFV